MTQYSYEGQKYENPFKSTNADGMSYEQIVDSWSTPFFMRKNVITEDFYLRTPMSLILSGARGTGKTMMFKYYCFHAQAIVAKRAGLSLLKHFESLGSISLYLKFDPYLLQSFQADDTGKCAFIHLFELVVCEAYVEFAKVIGDELQENQYLEFCSKIQEILGIEGTSIELGRCIEEKINEVYDYMNERKILGKDFCPKKIYHFLNLSRKAKDILCGVVPQLRDVKFLWVIDEGENFLRFEQKVINKYIKTLNSREARNIYVRLGTRAPQINSFETINAEEFLSIGRDYEARDINYYTIESDERIAYREWLKEIAFNRLQKIEHFRINRLTDISMFLGDKEDQKAEVAKWASNRRTHFDYLLKDKCSDALYKQLNVENEPLLEMMNIWWYRKGETIENIKIGVAGYFNGYSEDEKKKEIEKRYKEGFAERKVAFLYLLLNIYKKNKQYYSFTTYSYLSIGNICNFIKLCREAFDNAYFENKELLLTGTISQKSQHEAAISVAYDEIGKVKYIPQFGKKLYALVINLGNLFNEYHSDIDLKNMESNQFSLLVNDEDVEELVNVALTWGVFLKKSKFQSLETGNKGNVYTLNKMYCPLFGISYRSKGRYIEILDDKTIRVLTDIQSKKVSSIIATENTKVVQVEQQVPGQMSLFERETNEII